jgi:uncharacterized iron-regulated membrane protein
MTLRRMLFWLHLTTGATVGLVIAFLAVTGCIMTFQAQVIDWAERDARISAPAQTACVAPSMVLKNAADSAHRSPTALVLYSDPHHPAEIFFGANSLLLADGCGGRIIGSGAGRLRGFFQSVRDLHRWVAWNGVRHENLRQVKDACVLAFLFLIVSGLVLWFPRKITWQHFRPALFLRGGLRGRAREWNWHSVFGFWMALPLAIIALTGIIMAYSWANALLYRAAGSPAPAERAESEPKHAKPVQPESYALLDAAIQKAMAQDGRWKSLSMRMPTEKDANVSFTLDEGDGSRPQQRAQLVVARKDARVIRWESFAANSRGRQWRLYARFLHTGEIFGIVGRSIAAIACLSALVLVWTEFSLALRRLFSARKRKVAVRGKAMPDKPAQTAEELIRV